MGVTWRNGDLRTLSTELRAKSKYAIDATEQITAMSVDEAAELQRELLDRATTNYGRWRMERGRGNTEGRNDTGHMIGAITHDVEVGGGRVTGRWGWLFNPADTDAIRAQDWGTNVVPAAHSLLDSYVEIRERWLRRMKRLAGR